MDDVREESNKKEGGKGTEIEKKGEKFQEKNNTQKSRG